jgi:hypothetical protein
MTSYRGQIATALWHRDKKVLALWVKQKPVSDTQGVCRRIARLRVPPCIKDFIVVYGGDAKPGRKNEFLVIVNVNQSRMDVEAFNTLNVLVRQLLKGAYEELDTFPTEAECNPRDIFDDKDYLGWKVIKARR